MGLLFDMLFKDNKDKNKDNRKQPGVNEDWDEKEKNRLIKEEKHDEFNFEEEELEEDDYYYEDDK